MSARTVSEIEQHLVKDADKVSKWYSDNQMAADTIKTKVMLNTTWQKRASLPEHQRNLNGGWMGSVLKMYLKINYMVSQSTII